MFLLNLSTAFQLFQLFLVLLAVSHFLKQRASPSASLARNLPSTSPTMSASSQRASLSSKPRRTYDVFLSFFGKDSRNGFVGHLYSALKHKGILIYKDDKNLERGTYISQELLKAIEESKYAIVVISKNYAFSKWCLMEVTHIMKCMIETQLIVLPVFYHVDPSHVRNQQGSFANAFAMHMRNLKVVDEEMKAWKVALEKVGGLAGWHVHERYEAEFVEEVSRTIFIGLCGNLSNFEKNLVGIESQVGNLINLLEMDGVSFIGICGMGGIGKTTLAKFIYDRFSSKFEANSFIDVKEGSKSLVDMQRQLISEILKESKIELWNTHQGFRFIRDRVCNKKVLIVLDNMEEEAQIKKLVGSKDWHHQGSRILITSRDHQLLNKYVEKIYDVEKLGENDALQQLFSWKAFQNPHPKENYLEMSKDIVKYAEGLPLAIEVFGSSLFDKTMDEWRSAQDLFKLHPQAEILDKLKVSYDGLEKIQKDLFLDIVFFFNGSFVSEIIDILDSCDYYLEFNISVLKDRSLIKILDDKRIEVHDLLVKMGHQIVNSKSFGLLGKHSRLYHQKDIIDIMKNTIGTDMVEGIVLELPLQKNESLNLEAFSKMTNLRILLIKNKSIYPKTNNEFWEDLHTLKWERDPSNFNLSNKLCVITWWGYPLQSLPSNFQLDNLVKLQMPHSYINKLWDGRKSFSKLKEIDLKDSKNLIETPNFYGAPNLEKLVFSFCTSLSKVHSSIRFVKQLQVLDLKGCHCLKELLESGNGWKYLEEVDIRGTTIRKLSSRILDVESESNPTSFLLMKSLSSFSSLTNLNLSYCNMLDDTFFSGLGYLSSLKFLDLSRNKFTRIPEFVYQLSNLEELLLHHCNGIQALQKPLFSHLKSLKILDFGYSNLTNDTILNDIGCLFSLQSLYLEENKFTRIPYSISQLSNLLLLELDNCCSLQALPKLPARPLLLSVRNCALLEKLYSQMDARTSNEMMLTSDFSAIAIYVGYDKKPYMSLYVQPEKSFQTKDEGKLLLNGVAWGLAQGSKIPGWFNQRSINSSGTIQSCVKLDDYSNNWEGYALFIVYQVHELDSFQREIKSENADEFEKSNSRILFRNDLVFPEFSCQLQVNEGGPRRSFIFRIPEVVPVGSNGVWVYIIIPCFDEVMNVLTRLAHLRVSIATKSPNVEVKECGARLVPAHDHSEFYQVVRSISPQVLDETSLKDICCPCLSLWGL